MFLKLLNRISFIGLLKATAIILTIKITAVESLRRERCEIIDVLMIKSSEIGFLMLRLPN